MAGGRQAVSKHLAVLEDAGLVATVRRGREKLHYLNPVPIHEIYERWISRYEQVRVRDLHPDDAGEALAGTEHAGVPGPVLAGGPARQ